MHLNQHLHFNKSKPSSAYRLEEKSNRKKMSLIVARIILQLLQRFFPTTFFDLSHLILTTFDSLRKMFWSYLLLKDFSPSVMKNT